MRSGPRSPGRSKSGERQTIFSATFASDRPLKPGEVEGALRQSGLRFEPVADAAAEAARRIAAGEVVFWFQGRMEFGPRALGGRSILARPDSESLRDRLNLKLKRRVWYQPFCPSILDEEAERLLEGGRDEEPLHDHGVHRARRGDGSS